MPLIAKRFATNGKMIAISRGGQIEVHRSFTKQYCETKALVADNRFGRISVIAVAPAKVRCLGWLAGSL
jgi:hypothetical protein